MDDFSDKRALQNGWFRCGKTFCVADRAICLNNQTCQCLEGYAGRECRPVNECQLSASCPEGSVCVDMDPPIMYKCVCKKGYTPIYPESTGSSDILAMYHPEACEDVNECEAEVYPCHKDALCTNEVGSYTCVCKVGFVGDGKVSCVPPTPVPTRAPTFPPGACNSNAGCVNSNQQCVNSLCVCLPGYFKVGPNCQDIVNCDEAGKNNNCDPQANCIELSGLPGYRCACRSGWEDAYDGAAGTACKLSVTCSSNGAACSSGDDCCSGICA